MATYYLSPSGSDASGDGSYSAPWQTVSKAHTAASSGDTIILKTSVSPYTFASQTFTKSLTLQGETSDPANHVLDGAGASVQWTCTTTGLTHTFNSLTFQNARHKQTFLWSAAAVTFNMTGCIVNTSQAISSYGTMFEFFGTTHTVTLTACLFRGMATYSGTGSKYWLVINNGTTAAVTLTACTLYAPALSYLIYSTGSAVTCTWKNNILFATGTSGWVTSALATSSITYCDFYNITSSPAGTGVITSDPLFVDAPNGNFHLQQTSPCLNTGTLI